jgi:hypothetical protein
MLKRASTQHHTLSYTLEDGTLCIMSFGYKNIGTRPPVFVTNVTNEAAVNMSMVVLQQSGKIRNIRPSYSAPEVTGALKTMKKAVDIVEAAALNPHTELGRRLLIREFNRLEIHAS